MVLSSQCQENSLMAQVYLILFNLKLSLHSQLNIEAPRIFLLENQLRKFKGHDSFLNFIQKTFSMHLETKIELIYLLFYFHLQACNDQDQVLLKNLLRYMVLIKLQQKVIC